MNTGAGNRAGRGNASTRAQRRAAERTANRGRPVRREQHRGFNPVVSYIVGGLVTLGLIVAIAVYGLSGSSTKSGKGSQAALTDVNSLAPNPSLLSTGTHAPNFALKDVAGTGKTYRLSAQRGHPVLLEFFAVWCPVCQGEAPTIARLTRAYTSQGVRVWSILANPYGNNYEKSGNTDTRLANAGDLRWFARNFNVQHPQLVDPHFATVNRYGINSYPGLYVVDKKGVIRLASEGALPYKDLAHALDRALAG